MFFKIRHYVSSDTLKLLYYSLFYSFISYGIVVWCLTHPTILDCLFRLQKRVVRAISFKDIYAHSTPLFYKLKLLKLFDIHTLNLLSLVYECQNNQSVQPFDDYFSLLCTQSTTIIPGKHSKGISMFQAQTLLSMERDLLDTLDQSYGTVWNCL